MKKPILFLSLAVATLSAHAKPPNWFFFEKFRAKNSVFFFDMNSVVKSGSHVELWIHQVSDDQHPDEDGATSVTQKNRFDCQQKTDQILATMKYGPNRNFIGLNKDPDEPFKIPPQSVVEAMLELVCEPGFPINAANGAYSPVKGDDLGIYLARGQKPTSGQQANQESDKNAARKEFSDTASMLAAARSGDPIAQYMYGRYLYRPEGNREEGRAWMKKARPFYQRKAEAGIADFQFELANMLWNLNRGPNSEVRDWYKRAAAQGHVGAIKALEEF